MVMSRGFGRAIAAAVACLLALQLTAPDAVRAAESPRRAADPTPRVAADTETGDGDAAGWSECWRALTGLPPDHVAAATELFGVKTLVETVELRLPSRLARTMVASPTGRTVSAEELLASGAPAWRVVPRRDLVTGEPVSLTQGAGVCLPYPVTALATTPQPMDRGRTAAVVIETDTVAFCSADYLGRSERCYRDGPTRLVVLVGVPALIEPGTYPLEITLVAGGEASTFSVPLAVAPGRYGFQYIDPPPALLGLMDPALMAAESAYLERWRASRSPQRAWTLPLSPPLAPSASVSADYGDRRSYGGTVDGYHSGIDYRAWTGRPVTAPADGVVVMSERLEMRGNALLVDHGWGLVTGYWHLSQAHVAVGQTVTRGEVIAEVGNTGLSTGSHLHWEVWMNGVSVDGKQFLRADGLEGIELSAPMPVGEAGQVE